MIQKIAELIARPYRFSLSLLYYLFYRPTYNQDKDLGPSTFLIDGEYVGKRVDFEVDIFKLVCLLLRSKIEEIKPFNVVSFTEI